MIEFILAVVFVFIMLLWTVELTSLVYTYTVMAEAAKEGVRYAIVHGAQNSSPSGPPTGTTKDCTTNISDVQTQVKNRAAASFHDVSGMIVNVCYLGGNNQSPNQVQVTINYPYKPIFGSLGWSPPTINAASQGVIIN